MKLLPQRHRAHREGKSILTAEARRRRVRGMIVRGMEIFPLRIFAVNPGLQALCALCASVAKNLLKPQPMPAVKRNEGQSPRQRAHVGPLEQRPFPGVGFATDDGHGAGALHGEHVEDHQRHGE